MRSKALALVLLVTSALSACGNGTASVAPQPVELTVLAAASLKTVLPEIGEAFTGDHPGVAFAFSFGGTDQLAAQIQQGAPADVFAGASTKYGDQLAGAGLIEAYERFCTNMLVLITPSSNPAGIASLKDLGTKPAKLVIGSETVPVGSYTRAVLANLDSVFGAGYSDSVLSKIVSNEGSVSSIVTKVQSGEADAGFVYVTDALVAGSKVRSITLPAAAQAVATYPIAPVRTSQHRATARQFVAFVMSAPAQELLQEAGFGPPPES